MANLQTLSVASNKLTKDLKIIEDALNTALNVKNTEMAEIRALKNEQLMAKAKLMKEKGQLKKQIIEKEKQLADAAAEINRVQIEKRDAANTSGERIRKANEASLARTTEARQASDKQIAALRAANAETLKGEQAKGTANMLKTAQDAAKTQKDMQRRASDELRAARTEAEAKLVAVTADNASRILLEKTTADKGRNELIKAHKATETRLTEEIKSLQASVAALTAQIVEKDKKITELTSQIANLKELNQRLLGELVQVRQQFKILQEEKAKTQEQVQKISKSISDSSVIVGRLKGQLQVPQFGTRKRKVTFRRYREVRNPIYVKRLHRGIRNILKQIK